MKKRILCLLLVLLQAGMVACGNAEGGPESGETKSADMQTETAVESETEEADPFAGFNYDGKDFRIYTSTNIAAVSLGNSNYMIEGPEELTGDAAPDAAYERNLAVEDLLNVHFTYEHLDNRYDQVNATIKKYITAGEDAYASSSTTCMGFLRSPWKVCFTTSSTANISISPSHGGTTTS